MLYARMNPFSSLTALRSRGMFPGSPDPSSSSQNVPLSPMRTLLPMEQLRQNQMRMMRNSSNPNMLSVDAASLMHQRRGLDQQLTSMRVRRTPPAMWGAY